MMDEMVVSETIRYLPGIVFIDIMKGYTDGRSASNESFPSSTRMPDCI